MNRIILLICLMMSVSLSAFAQKSNGTEAKAKRMVVKLDTVLNLDDQQKAKILEIYSKPKDLRDKVDSQLKEILTAEQFKIYQDYKAKEKAKRADKSEKKNKGNKNKE